MGGGRSWTRVHRGPVPIRRRRAGRGCATSPHSVRLGANARPAVITARRQSVAGGRPAAANWHCIPIWSECALPVAPGSRRRRSPAAVWLLPEARLRHPARIGSIWVCQMCCRRSEGTPAPQVGSDLAAATIWPAPPIRLEPPIRADTGPGWLIRTEPPIQQEHLIRHTVDKANHSCCEANGALLCTPGHM